YELSELVMRAFILRRVALINESLGDVTMIGSQFSPSTLRLREFLTRNTHPYKYYDVERDPDAQAFLDRLGIRVDEIPVVICRGELVPRNPTIEQRA